MLVLLLCLGMSGCALKSEASSKPEKSTETVLIGGHTVEIDETLEQSTLSQKDFLLDTESGRISCVNQETRTGIDVSAHQGEIDWSAVAADGITFVMMRLGNRGYGQEGSLNLDQQFETNYAGARENGLETGVYFFSQAVSVDEAVEEADYVLDTLNDRELDLPVVFDWEFITDDEARTDGLDASTVTNCCIAFCEEIEAGGYDAAFYCNGTLGYLQYDLSQLQELDTWYAEYSDYPTFAYSFMMWQYSQTGQVAGIEGNVDLDLLFQEE